MLDIRIMGRYNAALMSEFWWNLMWPSLAVAVCVMVPAAGAIAWIATGNSWWAWLLLPLVLFLT